MGATEVSSDPQKSCPLVVPVIVAFVQIGSLQMQLVQGSLLEEGGFILERRGAVGTAT